MNTECRTHEINKLGRSDSYLLKTITSIELLDSILAFMASRLNATIAPEVKTLMITLLCVKVLKAVPV